MQKQHWGQVQYYGRDFYLDLLLQSLFQTKLRLYDVQYTCCFNKDTSILTSNTCHKLMHLHRFHVSIIAGKQLWLLQSHSTWEWMSSIPFRIEDKSQIEWLYQILQTKILSLLQEWFLGHHNSFLICQSFSGSLDLKYEEVQNAWLKFDIQLQNIYREMEW